jgi:hypothetical protein
MIEFLNTCAYHVVYHYDGLENFVLDAVVSKIGSIGTDLIGEEGVDWGMEVSTDFMLIYFVRRQGMYALDGYLQDLGWDDVFLDRRIHDPERMEDDEMYVGDKIKQCGPSSD